MCTDRFGLAVILSAIFLFFFPLTSSVEVAQFTKRGRGATLNGVNVFANLSVLAIVECGQHCLRYENCRGLNYKFTRKDDEESVNCQLSNQSDASRDNLHGDWTFYTTMRPIVPLSQCLDDSVCENGGKCVKESCGAFRCECDVRFEGKRCEKERVFRSCAEALNISSDATDGVYKIKTNTTANFTHVYCQMTSLEGCAGGGWTLVMKINGSKATFNYSSPYWQNRESFNIGAGQTAFDFDESKLPTFWSTSFNEICIGMKVGNDLNLLNFSYPARSLYSLFADGIYRATTIPRQQWKSLIVGSSLQTGCRKQGFNVDTFLFLDARVGYIGNEQEHCNSTDSYIGVGGHKDPTVYCGFSTSPVHTAGNIAGCSADNGNVDIKAMAYLLVR